MRVVLRMAALLLAGVLAGGYGAAPATAETLKAFKVSAVIANGCAITSTSGSNWGNIALGTVQGVTTGTVQASLLASGNAGIQMTCTPGMTANLTADTGQNVSSGGVRQMANGTARIPYLLYANGSTTPWTTQTVALAFPSGTQSQLFPVVAKATLAGAMAAGAYSDTVQVTVSW
jgi:spore coat protein U-like protein